MKTVDLRFPLGGVVRRQGFRDFASARHDVYPTPWAVNVCPQDPILRLLRGGSRLGLTLIYDDPVGDAAVAAIIAVPTASASGTDSLLVMLVDDELHTFDGTTHTSPIAYLFPDTGAKLCTDAGSDLIVGGAAAPAAAFLVAKDQIVYGITSSDVVVMDIATGEINSLQDLVDAADGGTVPTSCTFGALYRDRLFLAGDDNIIYCCRQGDIRDWAMGQDVGDQGRPFSFQLAEGGEIGRLPKALVPHKDQVMLAATAESLWVIQGDPTTGTLRNVSRNVGIIGSHAWVKVDDAVVFLARDGLYQCGADGSNLKSLSEERLPAELRDRDAASVTVSMGYNHNERGVYLFLAPAASAGTHWFFDLHLGGFWPVVFQFEHQPSAVCQDGRACVLAGADAYLRTIGGDDDDGEAISSHVLIGPFRLSPSGHFGLLKDLHGALGMGSADVTWRLVAGDTEEEAAQNAKTAVGLALVEGDYSGYVSASGTFSAGRSYWQSPRVRGMAFVLWLSSSGQWAFEGVTVEADSVGRWR